MRFINVNRKNTYQTFVCYLFFYSRSNDKSADAPLSLQASIIVLMYAVSQITSIGVLATVNKVCLFRYKKET